MLKVFNDRWELVEPLGEGGQAHVFRVRDRRGEFNDLCVLKRLKNRARLDRFKREIEAHQTLDHPGIARVLDVSLGEPAFFVTPSYPGTTLEERAPLSPLVALRVFIELCEIVIHAHSHRVYHRDLKPTNILWTSDDRVIVLDFGLCYFEDDANRLTDTMEQVGSRFYMSPELEAGRADTVTDKVDSYALGKILHYLLTGRHVPREAVTGSNDVAAIRGNPQLQYVTDRILRKVVLETPQQRLAVTELHAEATTVFRLINEHRYPGTEGSVCRFCGEGHYQRRADIRFNDVTMGRATGPLLSLRQLVCTECGHVDLFALPD